MKNFQKPVSLLAAAIVSLLAACSKTPPRPDPSATVLNYPSGSNLAPTDLLTVAPGTNLEVRDPNIIETDDMIKGLLKPVYYAYDSSVIAQEERAKLQAAADYLKANPNYRLLLEGHCDWRGTDEYNLGLGDRRATAAKSYLTSIGVAADKLEIVSKGSLEAAKNADDATMRTDRRAEIIILKKAK
jgi:peptidoglycan-associated lipoprotein